jgi:hypothetical protein
VVGTIPKAVMAGLDPAIHACRMVVLIVIGLAISACTSQSNYVRPVCPAGEEYFPRATFQYSYGDATDGYARRLRNMGEPSLSCAAKSDTEAYRLLWLPSFSNFVAVRLSREAQEYRLDTTSLSPTGDETQVVGRTSRLLTESEWREFKAVFAESDFWQMPATLEDIGSTDGWRWVMEAQDGSRYHAIDRQFKRGATYEALGLRFLHLAGIPARGR